MIEGSTGTVVIFVSYSRLVGRHTVHIAPGNRYPKHVRFVHRADTAEVEAAPLPVADFPPSNGGNDAYL